MYDQLTKEAEIQEVEIIEIPFSPGCKGFYADKIIAVNSLIESTPEKLCILTEELGHYHTSYGDITDQSDVRNRKQEIRARRWAVQRLIQLDDLMQAFENGVRNRHELAEFLGVTEKFIDMSLEHFKNIYGHSRSHGDYTIYFDPLWISRRFE